MKINMFEGARRILKLVAVVWIAGVCYITLFVLKPYIVVKYAISGPEEAPVRCRYGEGTWKIGEFTVEEVSCDTDGASWEWFTVNTKKGSEAHVDLYFLAHVADNGQKLVPYYEDSGTGQWWMSDNYSPEVKAYTTQAKNKFVLPVQDEEWIDSQWRKEQWEQKLNGGLVLIGGLVFLWGLSWVVGWVVRGFLGIPHGKDSRADEALN